MRAILYAIPLILATSVGAQEGGRPGHFVPEWEEPARGHDFARFISDEAVQSMRPGFVVLCCQPDETRRIGCDVAFEAPRDLGYARAALRASRTLRLTPQSYTVFQAQSETHFRMQMNWQFTAASPATDEIIAAVESETRDVCRLPEEAAELNPD